MFDCLVLGAVLGCSRGCVCLTLLFADEPLGGGPPEGRQRIFCVTCKLAAHVENASLHQLPLVPNCGNTCIGERAGRHRVDDIRLSEWKSGVTLYGYGRGPDDGLVVRCSPHAQRIQGIPVNHLRQNPFDSEKSYARSAGRAVTKCRDSGQRRYGLWEGGKTT